MDCYRYCLTSLAFSDFTFGAGDYTRCPIKHEFPSTGYTIVANDIGCPIVAKEFKIAMIRGQPAIQHLYDLNFIVGQDDKARRFFAPISGITVYVDLHMQPPIFAKISNMPLIEKSINKKRSV